MTMLALIIPVGPGTPDNSLPGYGWPGHPGQGLPPVHGHPDHGLPPGHGRPDHGLPGGGHPGNRPPGSGLPPLPGQGLPPSWGLPDNSLPGGGHISGQPILPGATPHGDAVATKPPDKVDANEGAWVLVDVNGAMVWAWAQKPKAPVAPTHPIGPTPPSAQPKA